jgi:drug/metabolite transporter (DMT)-like permease
MISIYLFDHSFNLIHWIGIILVFGGTLVFFYIQTTETQTPKNKIE